MPDRAERRSRPGLGKSELAARGVGEVLATAVPAPLEADALSMNAGVS